MDIEYDQSNERGNNRSNSLDRHRLSYKSRKSNQSCLSIGGTYYHPSPQAENQKISLQSNISAKARQRFNNSDLFDKLAYQDPYYYQMRDQGSFKPKQRNTQGKMMIQEGKMSIELQPSQKVAEVSCKCPKSKCLLMYCECFSKGILCNQKCTCYQCRNNPDFEEKRQKARRAVLDKDPDAFRNKGVVEAIGQEAQLGLKKGCNCKKTNCIKKYCQCFFTGVKCSYLCNCQNCMNGGGNSS